MKVNGFSTPMLGSDHRNTGDMPVESFGEIQDRKYIK
jgi:hypothetical protein